MITTLEQASIFLVRYSEDLPGTPSEWQLISPGIDEQECMQICEQIPGIPESYLSVARRYNLAGLKLPCMFKASPIASTGKNLLEMLLDGNGASMGIYHRLVKLDLIHIAGWEADYICCYPNHNASRAGGICLISDYFGVDPVLLAPSFEVFILLVCNLQVALDSEAESTAGFRPIVTELAGEIYWTGWKLISDTVF